jgi:hypothetical protein
MGNTKPNKFKTAKKLFLVVALLITNYSILITNCFSQGTWTAMSTTNAPSGRSYHSQIWTGNTMIVWGGGTGISLLFNTGGIYNSSTGTWTNLTTVNAPSARTYHTTIWTGTKMIVWGGDSTDINTLEHSINTGGIYVPVTDTWTATSTTNAPPTRYFHSAIWTGSKMIIWGGAYNSTYFKNDGYAYDTLNNWTAIPTFSSLTPRYRHTAIWTGTKMIIWGGGNESFYFNDGGIYNDSTHSWTSTSLSNAPSARYSHTAIWTGSKMIVWGGIGQYPNTYVNTGGIFDPETNTWTPTSTVNAPSGRCFHSAVWTGTKMIIWGGRDNTPTIFNTGGFFDPETNTWTTMSTNNAPQARRAHKAIWTGSKMIIWGGTYDGTNYLNTGGIYYDSTLTGIVNNSENKPESFSLSQNYPNPFNPKTVIRYQLPVVSKATLKVYDLLGKEVSILVDKKQNPGTYEVEFDGSNLSSGTYYYRLSAGEFTDVKKLVLLK